jgi:hypothetical protein
MRAHFVITAVRDGIIYLRDLDGPVSVTNDAEAVYAAVRANIGPHRVVYEDSYGEWAEIIQRPNGSIGFKLYPNPLYNS